MIPTNPPSLTLVTKSEANTAYSFYLKRWWQRTSIKGWGYPRTKFQTWGTLLADAFTQNKLQCLRRTMPFLFLSENIQGLTKCQYFHWSFHPLFSSGWLQTLHGLVTLKLHNEDQVYHKEKCPVRPAGSFSAVNRLLRVQCTMEGSSERVFILQNKIKPTH